MTKQRVDRLNSLLKEVISEVIRIDLQHYPHINEWLTVTGVEITKDLRHAKVYISVMGSVEEKKKSLETLQSMSGLISKQASKKVRMRFFPELLFKLDESIEKHLRIQELLQQIHTKPESDEPSPS